MAAGGSDDTITGSLPTLSGGSSDVADVVAGRYHLVRWLGAGSMGRVYEVLDTELGERVALKMLRTGLSDESLERFRREVRLTRRIQHPNVARMHDIGEHDGDKFLTMEYVDGARLTRELGTPMPWPRLQKIALQLCAGLSAAHRAGVIHRDLKPDNIVIERGTDRAVITDFGIARSADDVNVTQVGMVIGTPRYMAPEQLAGGDLDARADVFSLGVMLYELATAARPWDGDSAVSIAVAQATKPMRPLVALVPPAFVELITACLAIDRERRPARADDLAAVIGAAEYAPTDTSAQRAVRAMATLAASPPANAAAATLVPSETTIAVLPFHCAAGDEYLADGLVEELVDLLSTTVALRVRPAGILRSLSELDPREAGRQLGVQHVVAGALRRGTSGLRLSARLVGIADGFQIWAHRAHLAETDVLNAGTELARGVAHALSTRTPAPAGPMPPAAVDYYLRARAELRRFWGEHAEEATKLLEQAAAIAPSSGPILSTLAYATVQTWMRNGAPAWLPRAEAAVARGLATRHGEAHLAASNLKLNQGDLEGAAHELGLAITRSPMSPQAHESVARLLLEIEPTGEGRRHLDAAIGLDPGRTMIVQPDLARLDAIAGDWTAVDQRIARLVGEGDPALVQLGAVIDMRLSVWRGDPDRASASLDRLANRRPPHGFDLLGTFRRWRDTNELDRDAWLAHVRRTFDPAKPHRMQLVQLQLLAEVAAFMQEDRLLEPTLAAAADAGLIDVLWLDGMPLFARTAPAPWFLAIRDRVAALAASVLAAYRQATG